MSPLGRSKARISALTWSPLTESNRRPSPYHGEAWRSLKVVDPGQVVSADRTSSAGVGVVAALLFCTCCTAASSFGSLFACQERFQEALADQPTTSRLH